MMEEEQLRPAQQLGRAFHEFMRYTHPRYDGGGLNPPEGMTLAAIYRLCKRDCVVYPSLLSEEIGTSRPAITAILNSLEEKGYVRRCAVAADRRRQEVILTSTGELATQRVMAQYEALMSQILAGLEGEEPKILMGLFYKVATHFKANGTELNR